MLTEIQVKKLMSQLVEASSSTGDIEIPHQLKTLGSLMSGEGIEALLDRLGPEGTKTLQQYLGVKDVSNLSKTDLGLSEPAPNIPAGTSFMHPLGNPNKYRVGSGFKTSRGGRLHKSVDIPAKSGTPVYAPSNGTVLNAGDAGGRCGGFIKIDHGNYVTKYCHLRQWAVTSGQSVQKGQIIGYVGGGSGDPYKGVSSGSHLHYEILTKSNVHIDPQQKQFGIA